MRDLLDAWAPADGAGPFARRYPPLASAAGMFGPLSVTAETWDDGESVRVLRIGSTYQSATYLDDEWYVPVFEYYYLYDLMFQLGLPARRVLMLGGGGYSYPKWLLVNHPDVRLDVVEIDPAVTQLARDHFYLDRLEDLFGSEGTQAPGALELVQADGRDFLEKTDRTYGAILNDTFTGRHPVERLCSAEAVRLAHRRLAPGGVYLSNVIGGTEGRAARYPRAIIRTLRQAFAHVYLVPCGYHEANRADNNMVIATDSEVELPAGYEPWTTDDGPILRDPAD